MQTRDKSIVNNSIASIINQIIILASGFLVPKILLTYYGSYMNGLISSITQFIGYFNIVEAGLGGAAIFSLYKPLATGDRKMISKIVSTTSRLYYQVGLIFFGLVAILAFLYPLAVHSKNLSYSEVTILVLVLGLKGVIDFFSLARFRTLLTADKKIYVVLNVMSISQILNIIIIVSMATLKSNIIVIYTLALIPLIFRSIILYAYVKKNYPYIDFQEEKDSSLLRNRWDVLYLNVVQAAQSGAPTIIATFTMGLVQVSVYSIYNIVFGGINMLFTVLTNSLVANFGDLIAKKNLEGVRNLYGLFEFVYTQMIAIIYGVSLIVLLPFINLYTRGVNNTNYLVSLVALLFVINGFSYNMKSPQGMLIMAAGHYRETRKQSSLQAGILIVCGTLFSIRWGLAGLLVGVIVSNLYRTVENFFYVPRNILLSKPSNTLKNYIPMFVTFSFSFVLQNLLNVSYQEISSWTEWVFLSMKCTFYVGGFALLNSLLFRRKQLFLLFNYARNLL